MAKFKQLKLSDDWKGYLIKYPRGYTILENLIDWLSQTNKLIDNVNDWNKYLDDFVNRFDVNLQEQVVDTLSEWQQSGFLDVVINEALQTQIDELEEDVKTNYLTIEKHNIDMELKANKSDLVEVNVLSHGADPTGTLDNTEIVNSLIESLPSGSRVVFPKGTYKGNFKIGKPISIDFQNSVLINELDDEPIISVSGEQTTPRLVTGNPKYGQKSFILADTDNLQPGDIGYLYDESVRPGDSTPKINVELIKIANVVGSQVFVEDIIRSDMNTGSVYFVKMNKLKGIVLKNVEIKPTQTHNSHTTYIEGCDSPLLENVETRGFKRHGVRFVYSYNPIIIRSKYKDPIATGSGQGYGLSFSGCRSGYGEHIEEIGCRHTVDMSGSYHCLVENIKGTADVYLSHNGYGGYNTVRNFTTKANSAAATVSRQGIADLNKVVARGYTIENIDIVVPDNTPDIYNALIYIQTDYADIKIDGVRVTFVNDTVDPVGTNPSHLIRFNGNNKGDVIINNVEANTIGTAIRLDKRSNYDNKNSVVRIDNVRAEKAGTLVNSRGIQNLELGSVKAKEIFNYSFNIVSYYTPPYKVSFNSSDLGGNVSFNISGQPSSGLLGRPPKLNNWELVTLSEGGKIDEEILLGSSELVVVTTNSPITLNSSTPLDPPKWAGQTVKILLNSISEDITIPTGTNVITVTPIVMEKRKMYEFIAYNGNWYIKRG